MWLGKGLYFTFTVSVSICWYRTTVFCVELWMLKKFWCSQFRVTVVACRSEAWQQCCCAVYTRRVLKSSGRSFLQSRKHSWKREQLSAYRASRMQHLGKRSVNVVQNLHAICWVSADRQLSMLASNLLNLCQNVTVKKSENKGILHLIKLCLPYLGVKLIEGIRRQATKMVQGIQHWKYDDRPNYWGLMCLERRRVRIVSLRLCRLWSGCVMLTKSYFSYRMTAVEEDMTKNHLKRDLRLM